ncbi:MAG: macro domain-containing protein [Bacteroidota bacterium]
MRNRLGACKVGEVVITTAGNLPAQKVIHTVGPTWNRGGLERDQRLASCYQSRLQLAEQHELKTIAFPNISTRVDRFPKERTAQIAYV